MTSPASVRGFNLKNHEELKKNSQLIEKWHRFSLGVCEKSHTPGTDRVKGDFHYFQKIVFNSTDTATKMHKSTYIDQES